MKKILTIGFALMLGLALALPALADVNILVNVTKDKDVTVTETITKTKDVNFTVTVLSEPLGVAESIAMVNQTVTGVVVGQDPVCENLDLTVNEGLDGVNDRHATIDHSVNENVGIVGVNQDAGNANNQGNAYAVSLTDVSAFANSEASADQLTAGNNVTSIGPLENFDPLGPAQKVDRLERGILLNTGIVGANQSVGNANNQANAVSMAAGLFDPDVATPQGVLVALAEADLGQVTSNNVVVEANTIKNDLILGSIDGNIGITSFNQSAGNMNNQANIVSISFTTPNTQGVGGAVPTF